MPSAVDDLLVAHVPFAAIVGVATDIMRKLKRASHMHVGMRVIMLVAVVVLLSGCTDKVVANRPGDWDTGEELLAHTTGRAHSGAFDARVFPQGDLQKPATCVAYRGNHTYDGDTCSIITDSSEHWFPIGDPAWGIMAEWQGRFGDTADHADPDHPRTVVAYDPDRRPIAYWAGANHPDASHATE